MATPVDVGDDLQLAMQDAVKDRRRARKMLRDEVKNVIRRQKEGKDGVDFGEFDSCRRSFFVATRRVVHLAVRFFLPPFVVSP